MRKLLITIVYFLILNSLFITHATAVVTQCKYITDHLDTYSSPDNWKEVVNRYYDTIKKLPRIHSVTLHTWRHGTSVLRSYKHIKLLWEYVEPAASEMGVSTLYDSASFKELKEEIITSKSIPGLVNDSSFAEFIGMYRNTVRNWAKADANISYEGQLRLNLLKKYWDNEKALRAAAASGLNPNSTRPSVIVSVEEEMARGIYGNDLAGPSQAGTSSQALGPSPPKRVKHGGAGYIP